MYCHLTGFMRVYCGPAREVNPWETYHAGFEFVKFGGNPVVRRDVNG